MCKMAWNTVLTRCTDATLTTTTTVATAAAATTAVTMIINQWYQWTDISKVPGKITAATETEKFYRHAGWEKRPISINVSYIPLEVKHVHIARPIRYPALQGF